MENTSVCEETGLLPRAGCPVITEYFDVGTLPTEYCDQHFYEPPEEEFIEYDVTPTPEGEMPNPENPDGNGDSQGGGDGSGENPDGDDGSGENPGGDDGSGENPGGDDGSDENPGGDDGSGEAPGGDDDIIYYD